MYKRKIKNEKEKLVHTICSDHFSACLYIFCIVIVHHLIIHSCCGPNFFFFFFRGFIIIVIVFNEQIFFPKKKIKINNQTFWCTGTQVCVCVSVYTLLPCVIYQLHTHTNTLPDHMKSLNGQFFFNSIYFYYCKKKCFIFFFFDHRQR